MNARAEKLRLAGKDTNWIENDPLFDILAKYGSDESATNYIDEVLAKKRYYNE
jgi:hypothetical protein